MTEEKREEIQSRMNRVNKRMKSQFWQLQNWRKKLQRVENRYYMNKAIFEQLDRQLALEDKRFKLIEKGQRKSEPETLGQQVLKLYEKLSKDDLLALDNKLQKQIEEGE